MKIADDARALRVVRRATFYTFSRVVVNVLGARNSRCS